MKFLFLSFFFLFPTISSADNHMDEKSKAMMEQMDKMSMPGENHARLKKMVGSWKVSQKCYKEPGASPMESSGMSENKMILGDRFLHQEYKGKWMGRDFEGMGITGYDNTKKMFVATWIDNMSSSLMMMMGTADASGNIITMTGDYDDMRTKKKMKMKTVTRIESDDRHVFEMWMKDAKGKEYKSMEMIYTRD